MHTVGDLAWMSGSWAGDHKGGLMEEAYSTPAGGTILGTSRIVAGGKTVHREFVLIADGYGGVIMEVTLRTKTGRFTLTKLEGQCAVFEDPTNDFPSVITYLRDGDRLTAKIEGAGREEIFAMTRVTS